SEKIAISLHAPTRTRPYQCGETRGDEKESSRPATQSRLDARGVPRRPAMHVRCCHVQPRPLDERKTTMSQATMTEKPAKKKLSREQLRLLSEIERQNYYTDQLDDEKYEYPLFSGKQAVLSQRRSGYRTSAKAAREIIDNALEAGAKNVWVIFDRPEEASRGKHERKNAVSAIAFIDDGPGMTPKMARYAPTGGGGPHHEDPVKIGKFGFGLPNSSINQTRRVEVYSRTDPEQPWVCAVLDITDLPDHGLVSVRPPKEAQLPKFVQQYLTTKKI